MNSIIAIRPYMTQGIWVSDDAAVGLREEPFISGADTIIERMVADIPDARDGFYLALLRRGVPWLSAGTGMRASRYERQLVSQPSLGMEGWLCPALLKYFESPPNKLYAQFRAHVPNRTMEPTR